ncbi:MAG: rhodanese-like domain-containing protein [Myxococcaceae bacterium]
MKRTVLSLTTLLALAVPSIALACADHAAEAKKAEPKKITVAELATLREAKQAKPVDVNGAETRAKFGVIPGAVLLTSSSAFDPAKELPAAKDSKLVFYCANTRCTASTTAALRALGAGYTDVSILPDGIKGWKDAGKTTELPRS